MTRGHLLDRILEQLAQVRLRCPELRLGQLIAIVSELAQDETGYSLWDGEDIDFAAALELFAKDMARQESGRAEPSALLDSGGISSSPGSSASQPPQGS